MLSLRVLLYAGVILLLGVDVLNRFFVQTKHAEKNLDPLSEAMISLPTINNLEKAQILERYRELDPNADALTTTSDGEGMSLSEQATQNGLMEEFYSGDEVISLKAVIHDNTSDDAHYALLLVDNIKDSKSEIIKVRKDDEVRNYSVTSIDLQNVVFGSLTGPYREIILPMYVVNNSIDSKAGNAQ